MLLAAVQPQPGPREPDTGAPARPRLLCEFQAAGRPGEAHRLPGICDLSSPRTVPREGSSCEPAGAQPQPPTVLPVQGDERQAHRPVETDPWALFINSSAVGICINLRVPLSIHTWKDTLRKIVAGCLCGALNLSSHVDFHHFVPVR